MEKLRASKYDVSKMIPILPLYCDRMPRRLLPNACDCAKGELAPLLAVPLISSPSAARWLSSAELCPAKLLLLLEAVASPPGALAPALELMGLDAFTSARWNAVCVLVGAGAAF